MNSTKPNIIFILIDDMGWKDLSCTGSDFYETPNIDRLSREGMTFTHAYAASPVCSPTRASLMSGKYPANVGVTDWINHARPKDSPFGHSKGKLMDAAYIDHLPLEEKSLATVLKDGGYQTWHVGKWHLGQEDYGPEKHGFDINIGGSHMGSPRMGGYFSPWSLPNLSEKGVLEGTYLTDHLSDKSIELMKERDASKPFFLNLWYYAVHTPIEAKEEKIRKYEKKAIDMGLDNIKTFEEGDFFPSVGKKNMRIQRRLVQNDATYAAMIESLDENVGRILNYLEESGLAKDTLVVFTSDNGGLSTAESSPTCNLPLSEGKGWMYEGGVREPLLVRWPGVIEASSTCEVPVTSPDFYPTLLEVAGLPLIPEQHEDGESILSLLKGGNSMERDAIYWHYPHYGNQGGTPGSSIRLGDWKLIEFFEDGRLELYNLLEDESETYNRVKDEPTRAKMMQEQLAKWRVSVEAKMPSLNPEFIPWSQDHKDKGFMPWD